MKILMNKKKNIMLIIGTVDYYLNMAIISIVSVVNVTNLLRGQKPSICRKQFLGFNSRIRHVRYHLITKGNLFNEKLS